jgi:hypothetical protein
MKLAATGAGDLGDSWRYIFHNCYFFLLLVFITTFLTAGGPLPEGPRFAHQKLKEPVFRFQLDVSPPFAYFVSNRPTSSLSLGLRRCY